MPNYAYERLSFLDQSFLHLESQTQPMHVAGVGIYEAGPLRKDDGGIDVDRVREYLESRLHCIPRYRQVLAFTPLENRPVWVDDQHFSIHYHVRHSALPRPGDERQLKRLSARIMSQRLDRSRPLWEMWVVEGLAGGDRFAIIAKVHHAMVDGVSSVDLLTVMLSPEPATPFEPGPRWIPRPSPTPFELFGAEARRRLKAPFEAALDLRHTVDRLEDPRSGLQTALRATQSAISGMTRRPSKTPLNQPIGPHRRFDWTKMSLAEVKAVRHALGGSLNDVVLATVSGGVRRFLEGRHINVETLDFRVMAPVSMRAQSERGTLGNKVSAWMVDLPLSERDPARAIAKIRGTTEKLKSSGDAMGAEMLTRAVSWTPSTLLSVGARLMTRALPFNLVVTNVPGPQIPIYLLGARMLENYGLVPLTDYLGLGIVLFSYDGTLTWGFNGDWDLLPDLHEFVVAIEESFAELQRAAQPATVRGEARPG
jgi:diacylglycerol O-acyltransferase / wax synthase